MRSVQLSFGAYQHHSQTWNIAFNPPTQSTLYFCVSLWHNNNSHAGSFLSLIPPKISLTFPGTFIVSDTLVLFFKSCNAGTAIYQHTTKNSRCGIANVIVDNNSGTLIDVSNGTNTTTDPIPVIHFAKSVLSSGEDHTINITFFEIGEPMKLYLEA